VFDKFKEALGRFVSNVKEKIETKEVKPEDLEGPLEELVLGLVDAGVAYDAAASIAESLKKGLIGKRVSRGSNAEDLVKEALQEALIKELSLTGPDIVSEAKSACSSGKPYVIAFFGVNGVGKTTTIAKVAKYLKDHGVSCLIVAADTFRAGAQEQLKVHAERLGVPFLGGPYGSDPASVAYNAIASAQRRGICAVLLDTAGRMHIDVDLMNELKKVVKVAKPHLKVLVVDSLTGNDAVEQARAFNDNIGVDAVIVTKVDADAKGGTIVSVVSTIKRPVIFVGIGQGYEDLESLDVKKFVSTLISGL
jgi:fused signal recognition particle receptor